MRVMRDHFLHILLLLILVSGTASAQSLQAEVTPLVEASCLRCHGDRTVTPLNLGRLGFDLTNHETFRAWEKVYERLENGEMPPATALQPETPLVETALSALKEALIDATITNRGEQRTPLRRLTRLEYAYTIQDLLDLDEAIAAELSFSLPAEADSGGFDTVSENQSMSPLHVRSYLDVASRALDTALATGPPPPSEPFTIEYVNSRGLARNAEGSCLGCGATKKLDDGYATFHETSSTYLLHSRSEGFSVPYPGRYRITIDAYAYQANTPVTLTVYLARGFGALALDNLVGSFDFVGNTPQTVELELFLRPGDVISPSLTDADVPAGVVASDYYEPRGNFRDYEGEGIALKTMTIDGPLLDSWPPPSTKRLLAGIKFSDAGEIELNKAPYAHIVDIVTDFGPRAFRRPLDDAEIEAYASLAKPLLDNGRSFLEAIRVPLQAILSAPMFLYHTGDAGALDDFELATRLSYFLWRSLPDETLLNIAHSNRLSDPDVLSAQVDRMLNDPKSQRFVRDFVGQAFRLYELRVTSPDPALYPEYDDLLGQAMEQETELFFSELLTKNLGVGSLIDADFTFLNRRLAEHYDLTGISGQQMKRVELPKNSPRGGMLTQASIHKITANGTTTSPIPRGNFVLANLLGKPAPPPPAGITALEPDTRGTTTIREQLDAHRASPVCASCHRIIDPPGFALESFDPIGGFRENYRVTSDEWNRGEEPYAEGPSVDASGITPEGNTFTGIEDYKQIMLENELDQVARHLASSMLVFSTGSKIEFTDRGTVDQIVADGRKEAHPIRTMIHRVVQSDLFRAR